MVIYILIETEESHHGGKTCLCIYIGAYILCYSIATISIKGSGLLNVQIREEFLKIIPAERQVERLEPLCEDRR